MALHDSSLMIGSKNINFDENERFLQYTISDTLPSKLASLALHLPSKSMSTPPALVTPSPRINITADPFMKAPLTQKDKSFSLRPLQKSDSHQVLNFLKRTFFIDEPLNIAVQLIDGSRDKCTQLEEYCKDSIREGQSVVAVSDDGEIIGCLLGAIEKLDKTEEDEGDDSLFEGNPRFSKILNFLGDMDKRIDMKSMYPGAKTYFDIRIISVDGTWRGQGLAAKMTVMGMELGAKQNVDFYKVGCSSIFSAKVMRRLGYTDGFKIKYADYKVDDQQVFYPDHPHTEYTICFKSK